MLRAVAFRRDAAVRNRLRQRFTDLFQRYDAALPDADAMRIAEVTLQVVKSLSPLYAAARPKERIALVNEYRALVSAYLAARLG